MSAEATALPHEQQDVTAAAIAGASESVAPSDSTASTPCPSVSCTAVNQQLIAQMQRMQQRIEQLERELQEATARPSVGASVTAAPSSPIRFSAAALCTLQDQSSSSLPTQSSSAPRLHKDALHCVLAYLYVMELPVAMRSCRVWYAAVRSLPLRSDSLCVRSARRLYRLPVSASSPLARHIVTCDVENAYIPISADDLAQFVACLPRLRSLSHSACRSLNLHPQLYSSQLRELDVDLYIAGRDDGDDGGDGASAVQVANLSSATGLHRLTLSFSSLHSRYISLASLAGMLELESLTLHNNHIIPQEQFVYIRRLSSLRTLSLSHWNDAHVKLLVEERAHCPPLQLHAVEEIDELNMQRAQLFIRMPTLQRVEPIRITPDALKTLAHGLPDLHTLIVNVSEATAESGWPAVRDSLAACHQLTDLTLVATPLEELSALLLALPPSLRKLDIRHCAGFLQSDAFFQCVAEGGLRQLEQLHVQLRWNEHDAEKVEAWHVRLHACAPWMKAVIEV